MGKTATDYFETQRRIKALRQHEKNGAEPDAYLPILSRIINGLPMPAISLDNSFLYRARPNEPGKLFLHLDELKYPKPEYVKTRGRLNDIGESVLYAALCELGTIIELRPSLGRVFTISKIEKVKKTPLIFFPIGVLGRTYSPAPKNKTEKIIVDYLQSQITKQTEINDDYNSTISLAHFFLKTNIKGDDKVSSRSGLIYPSVQGIKGVSNTTTFNVALSPEIFDAYYSIRECYVYFLSNEQSHYQLNEINKGIIQEDGFINWEYDYQGMKTRGIKEFNFEILDRFY